MGLKQDLARLSVTVNAIANAMNLDTTIVDSSLFPIKTEAMLFEVEENLLDAKYSDQVVSSSKYFKI